MEVEWNIWLDHMQIGKRYLHKLCEGYAQLDHSEKVMVGPVYYQWLAWEYARSVVQLSASIIAHAKWFEIIKYLECILILKRQKS